MSINYRDLASGQNASSYYLSQLIFTIYVTYVLLELLRQCTHILK